MTLTKVGERAFHVQDMVKTFNHLSFWNYISTFAQLGESRNINVINICHPPPFLPVKCHSHRLCNVCDCRLCQKYKRGGGRGLRSLRFLYTVLEGSPLWISNFLHLWILIKMYYMYSFYSTAKWDDNIDWISAFLKLFIYWSHIDIPNTIVIEGSAHNLK